jgi:uncharacterized integral membrane protein
MLTNMLITPSLHSLFITGILILFILFVFIMNYNKFSQLDFYHKITLLSVMSIAFGVHGLIHLGAEINYGFNPYQWFYY